MTEIKDVDGGKSSSCQFCELGLAPKLLEAVGKLNFSSPTPIQEKAIPIGLSGRDIFGIAQTGTGKTMAFGLPMLQRIARQGGRGLVVLPTRELALQVDDELKKIGRMAGLRTAVLIGGTSMEPQLRQLKANPHIIIATPGRILDHLSQKNVDLKTVKVVVLDEADRMLDMGFMPDVRKILMAVSKERQTMLFSATMPDEIAHLAERYMKDPIRVEIDRAGTPAELVNHRLYVVQKDQKNRLLECLLSEHGGSVLVFVRTRHGAARVCRAVHRMGHTAAEIHSDRSLAQRREALDGFKSGKFRVLVATDIAARGIDVTGIELVINYDVPEHPDDYIHRIGRTGRAGQRGLAVAMATPDQGEVIRQIEKLAMIMLDITPLPELPPDRLGGGGGRPERGNVRRPDRFGRRERPGAAGGSRPKNRLEGRRESRPSNSGRPFRSSLADGPKGIGISDLGDLIPEIGASFFEGATPVAGEKARRSGRGRSGRRR
ncbi:DEAD/DEAH box helicase [Candidatus Uhrbacteria bacterium]|nr:DEAD/DEAH box helicase [Candidatus Uhrbacteria bacterium]